MLALLLILYIKLSMFLYHWDVYFVFMCLRFVGVKCCCMNHSGVRQCNYCCGKQTESA